MIGYEKIKCKTLDIHNKFIFNSNEGDGNADIYDICVQLVIGKEKAIDIITQCNGKQHHNYNYYYFDNEEDIIAVLTMLKLVGKW